MWLQLQASILPLLGEKRKIDWLQIASQQKYFPHRKAGWREDWNNLPTYPRYFPATTKYFYSQPRETHLRNTFVGCPWNKCFRSQFALTSSTLPFTKKSRHRKEWPTRELLGTLLRPRANVESNSNIIHRTYLFWNRRMNDATFAAIKFDSN